MSKKSKKRLFVAYVTFYADTRAVGSVLKFKDRESLRDFVNGFYCPFSYEYTKVDRIFVQKYDYGRRWDGKQSLIENHYMINLKTNRLEEEVYKEVDL